MGAKSVLMPIVAGDCMLGDEMASITETVPTFEELKRQLSTELKFVSERQRNRLVREVIKIAKRRISMEKFDRMSERRVPEVRASIDNYKRTLTHIIKAINEIEAAKKINEVEDRVLMKYLQILEARDLLVWAAKDLLWMKDHLLPGHIPPRLRNWKDRKTRSPLQWWTKLNYAHWFIRELDTKLNTFKGSQGEKFETGRDRLIQKVLSVVFNENLAKKTIERIRNRND